MGAVLLRALVSFGAWFLSSLIFKAVIVGALYWLLTYLTPLIWGYVSGFAGLSNLTSLFNGIPDGIYWALYAMKADVGIPLCISAYVGRFLIRRLPVVG